MTEGLYKGMKIGSQVSNIEISGIFHKVCPLKEPSSFLSSNEDLAQM